MKRYTKGFIWLVVFFAAVGFGLIGCAQSPKYTVDNAPDVFECVPAEKLEKSIHHEAELVEFSCSFKEWKGSKTLHYKVAVKNTGDAEARYRVNIFMDNGKAVGGLMPRKTKKGLVKPGDTASFVYPVKNQTVSPKEVTLRVSTIGQ